MEPRLGESSKHPDSQERPGYGPAIAEDVFQGPGSVQVIWQGRWAILGVTLMTLVAGLWHLSTAIPIFESTSRVYVEKEGPVIISRDEGGLMTQSRNYLYTQAELFKSIVVLSGVLKKLDVQDMKTFVGIDNPLVFLRKSCLDISVGEKDEIISVSAHSPYPQEAVDIVNAVVEAYHEFHSDKKRDTTGKIVDILKVERKKRNKELEDKLNEIVEFKEKAGVLVLDSKDQNLVISNYLQMMGLLKQAHLETSGARVAFEILQEVPGSSVFRKDLISQELQSYYYSAEQEFQRTIHQLNQDLQAAEEDLRRLETTFTKVCPTVRAAQNRIQHLRKKITELQEGHAQLGSEFIEASRASARQRFMRAKDKEKELEAALENYSRKAEEANVQQARLNVLMSSMHRAEKLCDILDERIKEINVTEETGTLNISILDVAKPGESPVSPRKARTMAIALLVGLILGAGVVFLRDMMNKRLRSSDEMAAVLAAPVLGVLPHMKDSREISRTGKRVYLKPNSITAEAYRTVRTAIYFNAMNKEEKAKTLLITSPTSGDGKSTVTSNLAISMAQVGQRVLILDFDLRRSVQHKIFNIDGRAPKNGLSLIDVLMGKDSVKEIIHPTGIDGLDVLPNLSKISSNPSEVINSPEFADLLRDLAKEYDQVLIDSPPVMLVADARVLGALCDATIVVLRAEKSTRKVTELTREGLESVGARILGVAINDVPKKKGGYGHYYGYYGVSRYYRYDNYRNYRYLEDGDRKGERKNRVRKRREVMEDRESPEDRPI